MAHVICRLTAKNRDQLQNPPLDSRVWATFTFLRVKYGASLGNSPGGRKCSTFTVVVGTCLLTGLTHLNGENRTGVGKDNSVRCTARVDRIRIVCYKLNILQTYQYINRIMTASVTV